jgi:hypothetical protein
LFVFSRKEFSSVARYPSHSLGRAIHPDVSGQFVNARAEKLGKNLASLVDAKVGQGARRAKFLEIGGNLISVDVEKDGV